MANTSTLASRLTLASCLALVTLVTLTLAVPMAERSAPPRSCGEKGLCCEGQNNTCWVFGQRMDRNPDSRRCYCDSNCLIMGDCCVDYQYTCKSES